MAAISLVSLPNLPLIPLIYSSQVVNAVLLPLHVLALQLLARDPTLMSEARPGRAALFTASLGIALIVACVAALGWSWVGSSR